MINRREFIKTMSLLGGVMLAPVRWLGTWTGVQPVLDGELPVIGELFAGFLLLPEEADVPEFVDFPDKGAPNLCNLSGDLPHINDAVLYFLKTIEELADNVEFPIYYLSNVPVELKLARVYVTAYLSGEVYNASLGYDALNPETGDWECVVSISAQPDFPKPLLLYSSNPVEPGGPATIFEKTVSLPTIGIKTKTQMGLEYYWIENNVFYTLSIDPSSLVKDAENLVKTLMKA